MKLMTMAIIGIFLGLVGNICQSSASPSSVISPADESKTEVSAVNISQKAVVSLVHDHKKNGAHQDDDCNETDSCGHHCHFGHCSVLAGQLATNLEYFPQRFLKNGHGILYLNSGVRNLFRPPIS